jgi:hypothetical protein
MAVQLDASLISSEQARDDVDSRGLAAARSTEQRHHARGRCFEVGIQREAIALFEDPDFQHRMAAQIAT